MMQTRSLKKAIAVYHGSDMQKIAERNPHDMQQLAQFYGATIATVVSENERLPTLTRMLSHDGFDLVLSFSVSEKIDRMKLYFLNVEIIEFFPNEQEIENRFPIYMSNGIVYGENLS